MRKRRLSSVPEAERQRDLWLNHAAGYILCRDVRDYARSQMDPALSESEKAAACKAIDDALYGVTMILDGVPEPFENERHRVTIEAQIVLHDNGIETHRTDWFEGFCMGYHGWIDGEFGDYPPFEAPE